MCHRGMVGGRLNELALFSGAGGGILGGKLLGWRTICAVEIEPFRAERLAQRQNEGFLPAFPIWNGTIESFDGRSWRGLVDLVSGGFPCQDISAANSNAVGIIGKRSGLWREMLRVVREVGPSYVLVENSPNLRSRGLGRVLGDLAALGYDAQWGVLGADNLSGFHERKRLFILAYMPGDGRRERRAEQQGEQGRPSVAGGSSNMADADKERCRETRRSKGGGGTGWNSSTLANPIEQRLEERWSAGSTESQLQTTQLGSEDCLWLDREFIQCGDGKVRATKPGICGVAHGVANRVDRISAIGDGQVPAVVAAMWQILSNVMDL